MIFNFGLAPHNTVLKARAFNISVQMEKYWKPHKPHNCRRAHFHNYKRPCYYMITISKATECIDFSTLQGEITAPTVKLSQTGNLIASQIGAMADEPAFEIGAYIIMPDHIHILWRVKEWLKYDLGHYVGLLKSRCALNWQAPVFAKGFNDRIAFDMEMVERFSSYINDNPRRRLIAIQFPQLFQRVQSLKIGDTMMDAYGNFQLLRNPLLCTVIVSSRYTPEEKRWHEKRWEETIRTGGVLVSPFISPAEKEIMRRGIEEGASIIRIIPDGLPPKYKPSGREFDLCAEGRCLHLGEPRLSARNDALTRRNALRLNDAARWIVSHNRESMKVIGGNAEGIEGD